MKKIVKVSKDGFLDLAEVLDGLNTKVEDVGFYDLQVEDDNSLILKLYDHEGKFIKVENK